MLVVSPAICKRFTAGSTYNTNKSLTCHVECDIATCCVRFVVSSAALCYISFHFSTIKMIEGNQ